MKPSQSEVVLPLITQAAIFRQMPEEGHRFLAVHALVRDYRASEMVSAQGDTDGYMFGVLDGQLRGLKFSPDGRRLVFMYMEPGDWAGYYWAAGRKAAVMDIEAVARTRCALIPSATLREAGRRWPGLYEGLYMELVRITHPLFERLELEKAHPLRERVARILLNFLREPRASRSDGQPLQLSLSQSEIASFAFCSRQHANRTLQELAARGVISLIGRKMIVVNNLDALVAASRLAEPAGLRAAAH